MFGFIKDEGSGREGSLEPFIYGEVYPMFLDEDTRCEPIFLGAFQ